MRKLGDVVGIWLLQKKRSVSYPIDVYALRSIWCEGGCYFWVIVSHTKHIHLSRFLLVMWVDFFVPNYSPSKSVAFVSVKGTALKKQRFLHESDSWTKKGRTVDVVRRGTIIFQSVLPLVVPFRGPLCVFFLGWVSTPVQPGHCTKVHCRERALYFNSTFFLLRTIPFLRSGFDNPQRRCFSSINFTFLFFTIYYQFIDCI